MNKGAAFRSVATAALALTSLFSTNLAGAAEQAQVAPVKAKTVRVQKVDPNIKVAKTDKIDPKATVPAPPGKGGKKTRGSFCSVMVDNFTSWPIEVYVDGRYSGSVPAYGSMLSIAFTGAIHTYARVVFSDDTAKVWGPQAFECTFDTNRNWSLAN